MSSSSSVHPMLNVAVKAARAAGAIINRAALDVEAVRISQKQVNDFVTEVDQNSERVIIETLLTAYPDHGILAEESGSTHGNPNADHIWIIDPLDGTTNFILINTSHAGNVGATARAMKVMGFTDLVLVAPRWDNVLRREETIQRASGALDVLANARVVATLDEAIEGLHHLCATAMTPRDFGPPTLEPRPHFAALAAEHSQNADFGVGFLFGSERFGMRNEDVYRCHTCLSIPTDPKFGSLNLGAAVQVLAYDWREALGGLATMLPPVDSAETVQAAPLSAPTLLADAQQLAGLLDHWQQSLIDIGFLDPEAPKKLMPRLNQLFNRAQVTQEEIHILRGIAKAMSQISKKEV